MTKKIFSCSVCDLECELSVPRIDIFSPRPLCPKGIKSEFVFNLSWEEEEEHLTGTQLKISQCCEETKNILLDKNRKYGDSALNPVRVFSKSSNIEQILVRLDDKLSRIKNRQNDEDEDPFQDLIGYLILLRIAMKQQKEK